LGREIRDKSADVLSAVFGAEQETDRKAINANEK
jgi:hypothetical protein